MIYFIGMSHVINVLKAMSPQALEVSHENLATVSTDQEFIDLALQDSVKLGASAKAFVIAPKCGWGQVAVLNTSPEGEKKITAAPGYMNLINQIEDSTENAIFSFFNGNEHSVLSMVQNTPPYDFHLPWDENHIFLPGHQPVPYEVIRQRIEAALNPTLASLTLMRARLPNIKIFHVLPPPPLESAASILSSPEIFKDQLEYFNITPFSVRYKYFLTASKILKDYLEKYKIEILEPPAQAAEFNGGLKEEYRFAATHANEAYGALVVRQIQERV